MKLVAIKCPNCKGELKVNPEKDKLVCGYCHTEFLVDEEIKKTEHHHIYTDEAAVKKVESSKELELRKLEIEEKRREDSKKVTKVMAIITGVLLIAGCIMMIIGAQQDEEDSMVGIVGFMLICIIPWMWFARAEFNETKKK